MKRCTERIRAGCRVATSVCIFATVVFGGEETKPKKLAETWELVRIQGKDVGFSRTSQREVDVAGPDGSTLIESNTETQLLVHRFGQVVRQTLSVTSISAANGALHSFKTVIGTPNQDEVQTVGVVQEGELALTFRSKGKVTQQRIPWKASYRAPTAVEDALRDFAPAAPKVRAFRMFVPVYNQIASVALTAGKLELVELLSGMAELRRVSSIMSFRSGATIEMVFWIDERGEIMKSRTEGVQQETYRCAATRARMALQGQGFDLESFSIVKVKGMPADLAAQKELIYRVHHGEKDPAKIFTSDHRQKVKSIDPRTAQIRILNIDRSAEDRFTHDDLGASTLLQTDDPQVRSLAAAAAGTAARPAELVRALTSFVHNEMRVLSSSQGFASAADVATSRSGDCTEFAVLLAAMCRVREIPSRIVVGMVYSKSTESFGYHMWTEAWVDGSWIGLDATRPDGRVGLGHLKIASTNLKGTSAYEVFLPLTQALGQIELEVVTAP